MHKLISTQKNPLITGTLILTLAGLASRGIGFLYRLFLAQTFGEESMGLLQLISPVMMIAFSLTAAGMQTAISRYTASCVACGRPESARRYLFAGSSFCLLLSCLYALTVYGQADYIAAYLLKEVRLASLLKITAFAFPLSALHCCLNGYFYGLKEVRIPSFCQLAEQLTRTGSVFFLYLALSTRGKPTIALAAIGMVLGELVNCVISYMAYHSLFTSGKKRNILPSTVGKDPSPRPSSLSLLGQLLGMAVPLSCNRLIVNLLQSLEAVSIPAKLQEFGYSAQTALSIYGVLTGMAFSLILFPSAFTQSASVLLLPEVTQAAASSKRDRMKHTIHRSLLASSTLGILFGCIFFFLGSWAGEFLFHSRLAAAFIRQLSFLCPFLYLHATLSSILNGLKKTGYSLFINVTTLLIRLLFTLTLIPAVGIKGYLWGLLCSELFSTGCHLWLIKRSLR
ncbi:MAG: polysaccharide biosynthesis protein [Lachnospiraceae bacterium]|nr:polysaccharide biosynthesis protein [Lachnospiraceae bacterium]